MSEVPFTRPLTGGEVGIDVEGVGRALCKSGHYVPLKVFNAAPRSWRRTYGTRKQKAVNAIRKAEGWRQNGDYTKAVQYRLIDDGCFDERAVAMLNAYKPPAPPSTADLFRHAVVDFCERAERAENVWHYTQRRPFGGLGELPERTHYADCSSYVVLSYFWGSREANARVPDPSGYAYKGWGNTWDDLDGHPRVPGPFLVGDLAHYEGHVTVCRKAGSSTTAVWSSFGREAGPENQGLHYRPDLRFVCRPPLIA